MPVEGDVVWIFYSTGIVTNDVVVISSLPVHINCACANWHKQVQCLVSSGQSLIWLIQFPIYPHQWEVPWKKWRRKIILNDGSQRNLLEVQPQCGGVWIPSGISQIFWWEFMVLGGKCLPTILTLKISFLVVHCVQMNLQIARFVERFSTNLTSDCLFQRNYHSHLDKD